MGDEETRRVLLTLVCLLALPIFAESCNILRTEESVTCTPEMVAFFDEFPQYDGGHWRPTGTGRYCGIRIGISGSEEEVFAYYSEKLHKNSWEVAILEFPDSSDSTNTENRTLVGRQENIYYYEVNYELLEDGKRSSTEPFIRVDVTWRRR